MIETINFKTARPIKKDEYVRHADVRGIERIKLNKQYWGKPYIFICQGENERYFIAFGKLGSLFKDGNQFKLLAFSAKRLEALGYETGLHQLTSELCGEAWLSFVFQIACGYEDAIVMPYIDLSRTRTAICILVRIQLRIGFNASEHLHYKLKRLKIDEILLRG